MAQNVAPGVYSNTIDESFYTADEGIRTVQSLHTIFTPRGPDNVIVQFLSSPKENLIRYFGEPKFSKYGQSYHTALQWAEQGYETAVCRLMPSDATYANIALVYKKTKTEITTVKTEFTHQPMSASKIIELNELEGIKKGMKLKILNHIYTVDTVAAANGAGNVTMVEDIQETIPLSTQVYLMEKKIETKSIENLTSLDEIEKAMKKTKQNFADEELEAVLAIFYPYGRGVDYNKLSISIFKEEMEDTYSDFAVYTMKVYDRKSENGTDAPISDEEFTFSFDPDALDVNKSSLFIDDIIPEYSKFISYMMNHNKIKLALCDLYGLDASTAMSHEIYSKDLFASYPSIEENKKNRFANGSDGSLWNDEGELNWGDDESTELTDVTGLLKAFYSGSIDSKLLDKKWVPAKYIWDNNYPVPVKLVMSSLVEGSRNDIRAILDTRFQSDEEKEISLRKNGAMSTINNCNVAIYPNNGYTIDKYTGKKIAVTSTYNVCKLYAKVKNTLGFHYAIGGYNDRGRMDEMTSVTYSPKLDYRNQFTKLQLNTIINDPDGIYVMENITSQKESSYLQQNHVADTLQVIRSEVERFCEKYILTLRITDQSLKDVQGEVSSFLSKYINNGACEWIEVAASATPLQRSQQKAKIDVSLKFVSIAKQIELTFAVKGDSAN